MDNFNINKLTTNLNNANKDKNDSKNREFITAFNYLENKFDEATSNGKTSIIVDDNRKKLVYTYLNEIEDRFLKNGILLNYSEYPLIEIKPSPFYQVVNEHNKIRKRNIKLNFVVIASLITVSTIISYFILDCIPFFNPLSHPIIFLIIDLIIMSIFGAVYSKFK